MLRVYIATTVGQFIGSFCSSYMFELTNAVAVFTLSLLFILCGLIFVIYGVEESVIIQPENFKKV